MLASITPLGEGGRGRRWQITVIFYLIGSLAGGIALGGAGGLAGMAIAHLWFPGRSTALGAVAILSATAVALDSHRLPIPLPSVSRQVNEDWLIRYRSWVYGLGFGAQLGLGVVTVVASSSVYLLFLLALMSRSILAGLLVGAIFGLLRALPLLTARRITTPEALHRFHSHLAGWQPRAHAGTLVVETALVLTALVVVVRR
jgi:hypothetical protein